MTAIEFSVPGAPVGKGRPRIGRRGPHARMFTPEKTVAYESTVALFASQAMAGQALFDGPVRVVLHLVCAIPASWSTKKRQSAIGHQIRPTTKPDIDNTAKALFDAMNGVVWRDDVQVVELTARKMYGEAPMAKVWVSCVKPLDFENL